MKKLNKILSIIVGATCAATMRQMTRKTVMLKRLFAQLAATPQPKLVSLPAQPQQNKVSYLGLNPGCIRLKLVDVDKRRIRRLPLPPKNCVLLGCVLKQAVKNGN